MNIPYPNTLEQWSILYNTCAGISIGLEFFITPERIEMVNNALVDYLKDLIRTLKRVVGPLAIIFMAFISLNDLNQTIGPSENLLYLAFKLVLLYIAIFIFADLAGYILNGALNLLSRAPKGFLGIIGIAIFLASNYLLYKNTLQP